MRAKSEEQIKEIYNETGDEKTMFKELVSLKEKINNAHMSWVDLKVKGILNEEAVAEIKKIDWPSFPEICLENEYLFDDYEDFSVHCIAEHGRKTISAIIYDDIPAALDGRKGEYIFDLYDLHELSGDEDSLIGILEAKKHGRREKENRKMDQEWFAGDDQYRSDRGYLPEIL